MDESSAPVMLEGATYPMPAAIALSSAAPAPESIRQNNDGSVSMRDLEAQRAALAPGTAIFRVPAAMTQGQAADILYRVSASSTGTFQIVPVGASTPPGDATVYSIKIGRCMSAELHGAGFDITPAQEAIQSTGADRQAEWRWTVTPKQSGDRTLSLTSRILAYVAGRCAEQLELLPPQEKTVHIAVAPAPPAPAADKPAVSQPARTLGTWTWVALGGALAGIATSLTYINTILDQIAKLRDRFRRRNTAAG